jgi:plasmid stability protein
MPTLHVRNVPDKLYQHIQKLADRESRSLTAEVVQLLNHGIRAREARQETARLLSRIRRDAGKIRLPASWTDASKLIREDRSR